MQLDSYIKEKYFKAGEKIAVALSGGADSVFLLTLMHKASFEIGFSLYAIHVNHMIRGNEADRDENFCRELCSSLGVIFFAVHKNVPLEAKNTGKTLEEAARDARYSAFEQIMTNEGIRVIATAHNADDSAENILIRLIRGTSLDGICGIPKERKLACGVVVRPILGVSKREILNYCNENGIAFVTDSTNLSLDYTRNKIRNRIIPLMEEIDSAYLAVSKRNAELFARDAEYLNLEADRLLSENMCDGVLELSKLYDKHTALISRVVNSMCIKHGARPEREHIERICGAIRKREETSVSLPGKCRAVVCKDTLRVVFDTRKETVIPQYRVPLSVGENHVEIPECGLSVTVILREIDDNVKLIFDEEKYSLRQSLIYNLSTHKLLKFDTINDVLFLMNRSPGDVIDLGAFKKTLKKLMNEKHIPKDIRDILPCVEQGGDIAYVPFAAASKKCTVEKADIGTTHGIYEIEMNIKINNTIKDVTEE